MNILNRFSVALFLLFVLFSAQCIRQIEESDQVQENKNIPISFSLRYSGVLSPVRTQPTGGCWSSSAMITVESSWRKACVGDFQLSDKNLQLFHGFSSSRNTFGNHHMASAYFSRGAGPVVRNEKNDTTRTAFNELPYLITEARYLSSDPITIKKTIMDLGPVYSMMYFNAKNGLDTISNVYYTEENKINHVVVICGWNDTLVTNIGKGVWLAQNSLGVKFADSGFFYIPYQDKNIIQHNAIWPKWEQYKPNSKLYYYDTLGSYDSYGFGDTICYGLVKYIASSKCKLTRTASFINKANSTIEFSVYKELNEDNELGDKWANTESFYCKDAGYYTLSFDKEVPLEKGETFYIMAKYFTPNDTLPLPVESFIKEYSNPHIQSGKCWVNPDFEKWPTTWYECGKDSPYTALNFDLCIRAYCEED